VVRGPEGTHGGGWLRGISEPTSVRRRVVGGGLGQWVCIACDGDDGVNPLRLGIVYRFVFDVVSALRASPEHASSEEQGPNTPSQQ